MKTNNILYLTIITLLLFSLIPHNLSACLTVPVADDATKEKAEKEKDDAKKELDEAKKEQAKVKEENSYGSIIMWMKVFSEFGTGEKRDTIDKWTDSMGEAQAKSSREEKAREAQKKVDDAQEAYNNAYKYWLSVQDEERHPYYIPACGDRSHGLNMCDPDDMKKYTDKYWKMWHEERRANCHDYVYIDGIKWICDVVNFFWCQYHTHNYTKQEGSGSGSN